MVQLRDLIGEPEDPQEATGAQIFEARIDNTPADGNADLFVTIPEFDEGAHRFGPVIWRPVEIKGKLILPEKGAFCLVAKPSVPGHVWLIDWS